MNTMAFSKPGKNLWYKCNATKKIALYMMLFYGNIIRKRSRFSFERFRDGAHVEGEVARVWEETRGGGTMDNSVSFNLWTYWMNILHINASIGQYDKWKSTVNHIHLLWRMLYIATGKYAEWIFVYQVHKLTSLFSVIDHILSNTKLSSRETTPPIWYCNKII